MCCFRTWRCFSSSLLQWGESFTLGATLLIYGVGCSQAFRLVSVADQSSLYLTVAATMRVMWQGCLLVVPNPNAPRVREREGHLAGRWARITCADCSVLAAFGVIEGACAPFEWRWNLFPENFSEDTRCKLWFTHLGKGSAPCASPWYTSLFTRVG